jgi:hypothetical protein
VRTPEGCGSFRNRKPVVSIRTNQALSSIRTSSFIIWNLAFGICWGNYKNLEAKYEDDI